MPQSQLIVSSRYIKSNKHVKTKRRNFTKYIATRESVEKRPNNTGKTIANQKQLIAELIKEFPMAKQYLEYSDYAKNPSVENATELISTIIERHADVIGNRRNLWDTWQRNQVHKDVVNMDYSMAVMNLLT